jgi:hypothetical protein
MLLLCFIKVKLYYHRTNALVVFYIHSKFYCCKLLMYPVLNSTHVLDFLDTSSMGVTFGIRAGRFRPCLGSLSYNKVVGPLGSG